MRLFGRYELRWPVVQAAAPMLPQKRSDGALTEILPPFGTNPPRGPITTASSDLGSRLVSNDPRELWYLALPSKLTPKQVLQILRSALGGDIWQQWQLLSLMLDSWPMLRKCSHEIRQAVSCTKFIVRAYCEDGQEPTDSALEKAALVRRAMQNMRPDPQTDEKGFADMVYDLSDGLLNGLTMTELLWYERNGELLPRASCWVHPRNFTFGNDGKLCIFDTMYNRLQFPLAQSPGSPVLRNKFLIAQFMSRSGSSLGAGLMRPLAWDWSAVIFNREWMLEFAQRYGNPFLDATYKPGTPDDEIQKLNGFLANAGSQGWLTHVEGSVVNVHPAQSLGADNAQVHIVKQADEHCMLLFLGQTATTHGTPGKLGGEDTHASVKRENVQGVANWIARVLTDQFAQSIVMLNYGNDEEIPTITADFTEETDPIAEAQRDQVFLQSSVPMDAEEFYDRHNLKMPTEGDKVIVGGRLGLLGSTEQELGAPTPPPAPGATDPETGLPLNTPEQAPGAVTPGVKAKTSIKALLAHASDEELEELRGLLVKASQAKEVNGEWEAVQVKLGSLKHKSRIQL